MKQAESVLARGVMCRILNSSSSLYLFLGVEPELLYFHCFVMEMGRGLGSKKMQQLEATGPGLAHGRHDFFALHYCLVNTVCD
jgi:hypothetical protein